MRRSTGNNINTLEQLTNTTNVTAPVIPLTLSPPLPGDNPTSVAFSDAATRNISVNTLPINFDAADSEWISAINADNSEQGVNFRVGIIANLSQGLCDPNTYRFILRNYLSEEQRNAVSSYLGGSNTYEQLVPILGTILLGSSFYDEIGISIQTLIRELQLANDRSVGINFATRNAEFMANLTTSIENSVTQTNAQVAATSAAANLARAALISHLSWYDIARRAFYSLTTLTGMYYGAPIITPLITGFGNHLVPALGNLSETLGGILASPRPQGEKPKWKDVNNLFMDAWALLFKYWKKD